MINFYDVPFLLLVVVVIALILWKVRERMSGS